MKEREFYKKLIAINGFESQYVMCVEEMSELTKELCKLKRYGEDESKRAQIIDNIIIEIADVLLTTEVMKEYFGFDLVDKAKQDKIIKTKKILKIGE